MLSHSQMSYRSKERLSSLSSYQLAIFWNDLSLEALDEVTVWKSILEPLSKSSWVANGVTNGTPALPTLATAAAVAPEVAGPTRTFTFWLGYKVCCNGSCFAVLDLLSLSGGLIFLTVSSTLSAQFLSTAGEAPFCSALPGCSSPVFQSFKPRLFSSLPISLQLCLNLIETSPQAARRATLAIVKNKKSNFFLHYVVSSNES